jgi:hypothetical protein
MFDPLQTFSINCIVDSYSVGLPVSENWIAPMRV